MRHNIFSDVITGAGSDGGPCIRAFSDIDLTELQDILANPNARDGVLVRTANVDGKPGFEIIGAVVGRISVFGISDDTTNTNKYIELNTFALNVTNPAKTNWFLLVGVKRYEVGTDVVADRWISLTSTRQLGFRRRTARAIIEQAYSVAPQIRMADVKSRSIGSGIA